MGGLELEAALGMAAAFVGIAGLILLAPGPDKDRDDDYLRPGWMVGLVLVGLCFFWFGVAGALG